VSPSRNETGSYVFVPIEGRPFSAGVSVDDGFDLVHCTFRRPLPLDAGLAAAARAVKAAGRPVLAIAGIELRIPEQLTDEAFAAFNSAYASRLSAIGLEVDEMVPAGRTNVVPLVGMVSEPSVHGFSYTLPGTGHRRAFLISGIAHTTLEPILEGIAERMGSFDRSWDEVTAIQFYGAADVSGELVERVLRSAGLAASGGIRWFPALPPTRALALEIDVRSAGTELIQS
jgi:hypothetical protein